MTFQELKGKILFWVILVTIIGALLSKNFNKALFLLGILILGVIAYQIIGRFFLTITRNKVDPFNIKGQDLFPEKEEDNQNNKSKHEKDNDKHNHYNKIEQELLKLYSRKFATMGISDSSKLAEDMLDEAIKRSKRTKTYHLPSNFGNIILKQQKTEDPSVEKIAELIRGTLSIKKVEGVKNRDIKWWWNLHDVERSMMLAIEEWNRVNLSMDLIARNYDNEKASEKVWQYQPKYTYGSRGKMGKISESDKANLALPVELIDRINRYIKERTQLDSKQYERDIKKFSTFNAFIRKEIKLRHI